VEINISAGGFFKKPASGSFSTFFIFSDTSELYIYIYIYIYIYTHTHIDIESNLKLNSIIH
jgi:hypothetical protein